MFKRSPFRNLSPEYNKMALLHFYEMLIPKTYIFAYFQTTLFVLVSGQLVLGIPLHASSSSSTEGSTNGMRENTATDHDVFTNEISSYTSDNKEKSFDDTSFLTEKMSSYFTSNTANLPAFETMETTRTDDEGRTDKDAAIQTLITDIAEETKESTVEMSGDEMKETLNLLKETMPMLLQTNRFSDSDDQSNQNTSPFGEMLASTASDDTRSPGTLGISAASPYISPSDIELQAAKRNLQYIDPAAPGVESLGLCEWTYKELHFGRRSFPSEVSTAVIISDSACRLIGRECMEIPLRHQALRQVRSSIDSRIYVWVDDGYRSVTTGFACVRNHRKHSG